MLRKILIATDGSETSLHAAKIAVGIGKASGASITAVYVLDVHRLAQLPGYAAMPGLKDNLMELMLKEGGEAMGEIEEMALGAGVAYEETMAKGDPSEELLKLSSHFGFDLIVMGATGRSGLKKFLLGSVAEKVCATPKCPF